VIDPQGEGGSGGGTSASTSMSTGTSSSSGNPHPECGEQECSASSSECRCSASCPAGELSVECKLDTLNSTCQCFVDGVANGISILTKNPDPCDVFEGACASEFFH
jgi:hypothetical protein